LILLEIPFFAFKSDRKWFQIVTFVGLPLFSPRLRPLYGAVVASWTTGRHFAHT